MAASDRARQGDKSRRREPPASLADAPPNGPAPAGAPRPTFGEYPGPDAEPDAAAIPAERLPGEMETAMHSGSDDEGDLSNEDKYDTDLTPEEALRVLTQPVPEEIDERLEEEDRPRSKSSR